MHTKVEGVYRCVTGIFHKAGGTYSAISDHFVKVDGVYQAITCGASSALDILSSTYFYTDFCAGPYWSGDGGDDLFTTYASMTIYPELALSSIMVEGFDVTFELDGTQGALNFEMYNGDMDLLGTVAVDANATSAVMTVSSLPRQFNYTENIYIGHDIAGGFNWGITSIMASVIG